MIGNGYNILERILPENIIRNSPIEILSRDGRIIETEAHIIGNNDSYKINIFKVTGTVRIVNQFAVIKEITNLTNMTNVYADLWDGSNSVNLTLDGAILSGVPVGTFFTKDQNVLQEYSVSIADQVRVNEVIDEKKVGKPFTVTAKNGVDSFIRFCYTTNTILDFKMDVLFQWRAVDGGFLELV
jgi:hypothetical protein